MALGNDTCQVKTMDETHWEKENSKKNKKIKKKWLVQ
jgi:hypothetical protein